MALIKSLIFLKTHSQAKMAPDSGEASFFNVASQKWIARQALNARLEIFNEKEGGSHFMWLENPEKFNSLVRSFAD